MNTAIRPAVSHAAIRVPKPSSSITASPSSTRGSAYPTSSAIDAGRIW